MHDALHLRRNEFPVRAQLRSQGLHTRLGLLDGAMHVGHGRRSLFSLEKGVKVEQEVDIELFASALARNLPQGRSRRNSRPAPAACVLSALAGLSALLERVPACRCHLWSWPRRGGHRVDTGFFGDGDRSTLLHSLALLRHASMVVRIARPRFLAFLLQPTFYPYVM